jgi:hypothetical protein
MHRLYSNSVVVHIEDNEFGIDLKESRNYLDVQNIYTKTL